MTAFNAGHANIKAIDYVAGDFWQTPWSVVHGITTNRAFSGASMKFIRLLIFCGIFITSLAYASNGFILVQATSSDNSARSSSRNSNDKKSDTVVISTPKPRERVVPQTPQPSPAPPIPVIVLPVAPQR